MLWDHILVTDDRLRFFPDLVFSFLEKLDIYIVIILKYLTIYLITQARIALDLKGGLTNHVIMSDDQL